MYCTKHNCFTNNQKGIKNYPNFYITVNNQLYMFVWADYNPGICSVLKYDNGYFIKFKELKIPVKHMSENEVEMIFNFG